MGLICMHESHRDCEKAGGVRKHLKDSGYAIYWSPEKEKPGLEKWREQAWDVVSVKKA